MSNPQQPEVRRSERNPALSPDAMRAKLEAERQEGLTDAEARIGSDPNPRSPHHESSDMAQEPSDMDQDKPNLDDFAEVFGTTRADSSA